MIARLKSLIGNRSAIRLGYHHAKAHAAALRFGFPAKKLTVIGITGTDGKTTTCGMLTEILLKAGRTPCMASTAFFQIGNIRKENESHLTSIDAWSLQRFLSEAVEAGCDTAVIEVSSHALVQGRVAHTYPCVAAITNIALEHLDYHGSMEQYITDKGQLFSMLRGKGTKVLNASDQTYKTYHDIPSQHTITWSAENGDADLTLGDVQASTEQSSGIVRYSGQQSTLTLNIPGTYNLSNALCAIGCALALDVPLDVCTKALASFTAIPGRMERIDEGQNFSVFVDFAVSPQSYEKTLESLRKMIGSDKRVLVLCGSCGNRMKEKRPIVGEICSRLADVVVATEDETYGEDPHAVLEEVWSGVNQSACQAYKIFDRRDAIRHIFTCAQPGDAVVLCGMGPFSTFTKRDGRIPWDERAIAREILHTL